MHSIQETEDQSLAPSTVDGQLNLQTAAAPEGGFNF